MTIEINKTLPTVLHRLARWAEDRPNAVAQRFKKDEVWQEITAREYCDRVYYLALFLEARGITPKDICCILSPNCPQWVHIDLAAQLMGAKSTGLYPNATTREIVYVLTHSEAKVFSVRDAEFFKKVTSEPTGQAALDKLSVILVFDGDTSLSPKAVAYQAALDEGKRLSLAPGARKIEDYLKSLDPMGDAFLIYTSGTTGNPKGAILSHDNLAYTADRLAPHVRLPFENEDLFSFLPLCHIAEKLVNVGVGLTQRYAVNFITKLDNLAKEIVEVQPSMMLSVPRLWEKMMEGVGSTVKRSPPLKQKLVGWALEVGNRVAEAKYSGKSPALADLVQYRIADKIVLGKIRHAMGLGKAKVCACGAAALPVHVLKWFRRLGLEILEDYGQTESTGVICLPAPGENAEGSVGKPVKGMDVKIAEDGEILTRGRHVFRGYYKDAVATAQTVEDGWLHTGDLGEWTSDGRVRIRGRKKEIMKTSGGKMVAPLPIEEALKAAPIISQVCLVGDGRKFFSAVITLSESTLNDLKGKLGEGLTVEDPAILGEVKKHIDDLNKNLASYEQIKKFIVLSREFSIADGEMTPTLKMKRAAIETRYRQLIDQLYS